MWLNWRCRVKFRPKTVGRQVAAVIDKGEVTTKLLRSFSFYDHRGGWFGRLHVSMLSLNLECDKDNDQFPRLYLPATNSVISPDLRTLSEQPLLLENKLSLVAYKLHTLLCSESVTLSTHSTKLPKVCEWKWGQGREYMCILRGLNNINPDTKWNSMQPKSEIYTYSARTVFGSLDSTWRTQNVVHGLLGEKCCRLFCKVLS